MRFILLCRYFDQLTAVEGKLPIAENQVCLFQGFKKVVYLREGHPVMDLSMSTFFTCTYSNITYKSKLASCRIHQIAYQISKDFLRVISAPNSLGL